jgi:hypothetical protein
VLCPEEALSSLRSAEDDFEDFFALKQQHGAMELPPWVGIKFKAPYGEDLVQTWNGLDDRGRLVSFVTDMDVQRALA